jgi:hypothetical protein
MRWVDLDQGGNVEMVWPAAHRCGGAFVFNNGGKYLVRAAVPASEFRVLRQGLSEWPSVCNRVRRHLVIESCEIAVAGLAQCPLDPRLKPSVRIIELAPGQFKSSCYSFYVKHDSRSSQSDAGS